MEYNENYIVNVRGVLYFQDGKTGVSGNFIPASTLEEEIKEKLAKGQIIKFNSKMAADAQKEIATGRITGNHEIEKLKEQVNALKVLNKDLEAENTKLKVLNKDLEAENNLFKEEVEKPKNKDGKK